MSSGKGIPIKDRSGRVHYVSSRAKEEDARPMKKSTERAPQVHTNARNNPEAQHRLTAGIEKSKGGTAFLVFDDRQFEDIMVPRRFGEQLTHGDRVLVAANRKGEIIELEVIEHRVKSLMGRFVPVDKGGRRSGKLIFESKKTREEYFIPHVKENIRPGQYIHAKITFHASGPHKATAEIIQVLGDTIPASADVEWIAGEFGLEEIHDKAAEQEAQAKKLHVPGKDEEGRQDYRKIPFITIDGEDARDFDDAVFVEKTKSGYLLWVAVADVSHYVVEDSALDVEAKQRGTSVYFPERAFHMLPRALSENLCSLKPNEPRLAMVCKIHFSKDGVKENIEISNAIIQSHRRATYTEIEDEKKKHEHQESWDYYDHFKLYNILRKKRTQLGALDFELPENKIMVDKDGEPTEVRRRERWDSHRLVEHFMIAANEAVTEWMLKRGREFIYRVHEEPAEKSLQRFRDFARTLGLKIDLKKGEGIEPKVLSDILKSLKGHAAEELLNSSLLRSMRQAIYTADHAGHFGLASEAYTHFTSPIRRYPDLVVHRLLKKALQDKSTHAKGAGRGKNSEKDDLDKIALHCSQRERVAAEAEREIIRIKQVRMMMKCLGEEFAGKVNGMSDRGLYIQIIDPFVEGFVPKDSIEDDQYEYNEERMVFYGRRKKRTFRVGDKVNIQVVRAELDQRVIELMLLDS